MNVVPFARRSAVPLLAVLSLLGSVPAGAAEEVHAAASGLVYSASESTGAAQSPINIVTNTVEPAHHDIVLHYQDSDEHIVNLGHTIEADFEPGSVMEYDGLAYELKQLHFHTPAEHLVDGITYPMEMHMVHALQDNPQKLLVIGVLFREGTDNAFIGEVLSHAPAEEGEHFEAPMQINALDVLMSVDGYYHYEGSLTTPPYSETVTWLVMKEVHEAGAAQVERLNRMEGNNARHIQALSARHVEGE